MPWKQQRRKNRAPDRRPSSSARGYDRQWYLASRIYRRQYPLCAECLRHGITSAAYCVDHIRPHKGNPQLFWDRANWQSLCEKCHNTKSASE